MTKRQRQSGLTLLEVMVAVAIFSLAGLAAMKAASDHIQSVGHISESTFATWVANNRMTRVHLNTNWPPKNNQAGSEDMGGRTWYWKQTVTNTNDEGLKSVTISVALNEDGENSIASISSYIARPEGL